MKRRLSIAPMMDWTDRHYRAFARILTKHAFLYTEMVTTGALIYGDRERFLQYNDCEHPVALQLGGSDPKDLATCAKYGEEWGYDEINLNVGCPSDRVQEGKIGACLMAEPKLVADCIQAMNEACKIPVTVKTRLGLDDQDNYDELCYFIDLNQKAGCELFILHARNAWLQGLSPKQNRNIPPLKYDWVYKIKQDFADLHIELNGGVKSIKETLPHLNHVNSVMMGRTAYEDPWQLIKIDSCLYGSKTIAKTRSQILEEFSPYVLSQLDQGIALRSLIRHLNGLFLGAKGAKQWRQAISNNEQNGVETWKNLVKIATKLDHEITTASEPFPRQKHP